MGTAAIIYDRFVIERLCSSAGRCDVLEARKLVTRLVLSALDRKMQSTSVDRPSVAMADGRILPWHEYERLTRR